MWDAKIFSTDVYHFLNWFLLYSMLGWLVESIYMSFCNKRLTNRGFVRGPICPIYGVGFLGAYGWGPAPGGHGGGRPPPGPGGV